MEVYHCFKFVFTVNNTIGQPIFLGTEVKNDIAVLIGTASHEASINIRALSQFVENAVSRYKGSQTNFALVSLLSHKAQVISKFGEVVLEKIDEVVEKLKEVLSQETFDFANLEDFINKRLFTDENNARDDAKKQVIVVLDDQFPVTKVLLIELIRNIKKTNIIPAVVSIGQKNEVSGVIVIEDEENLNEVIDKVMEALKSGKK